jgi:mRNA interferase HigB
VRIISNSALRSFAARHPDAEGALRGWSRVIGKNDFSNWAELKSVFGSVDKVGELTVFNLGGNKYRLIAHIRFAKQIVYIRAVLHHRDYDKGNWKK